MSEYIEKQAFNDAIREAVRKYPNTFYNGLEVARKIAHDMDAADVQPVRRGRWIRHILKKANTPWGYDCSVCDEWLVIGEDTAERYNYCPICGAHMTEGEAE